MRAGIELYFAVTGKGIGLEEGEIESGMKLKSIEEVVVVQRVGFGELAVIWTVFPR